jgi:hypothetical protein
VNERDRRKSGLVFYYPVIFSFAKALYVWYTMPGHQFRVRSPGKASGSSMPQPARRFICEQAEMMMRFRISPVRKQPETTNMWGGAGQTALPTSILPG